MDQIFFQDVVTNDSDTTSFHDKANNFHIYPHSQNIVDIYLNGQPISIIIDTSNNVYSTSRNDTLSQFNIGKCHSEVLGHIYFEFDPPVVRNNVLANLNIQSFGLMIPKLSLDTDDEEDTGFGIYTIITSDWMEINREKRFFLYRYQSDDNEITTEKKNCRKTWRKLLPMLWYNYSIYF